MSVLRSWDFEEIALNDLTAYAPGYVKHLLSQLVDVKVTPAVRAGPAEFWFRWCSADVPMFVESSS